MENGNVLITGGSEGIGFELARCFAKDGYVLHLCASDAGKLEKAKKKLVDQYQCTVSIYPYDLSAGESAESLFREIDHISFDTVVNNAGLGSTGKVIYTDLKHEQKLLRVNIESVMVLSRLFAEKFAKRNYGEIINVASTGAFQPGPYIASYYASKAFVLSYTEALAMEMKGNRVRIYCYCPGPVRTAFYEKYGGRAMGGAMTAEQAAHYLYTHRKNKCVIVPGIGNHLAQLLPRRMKSWFVLKTKKAMLDEE